MNHLTLGFIGFGLIGGSIARVLKKKSAPVDILVYSRRKNPSLDTGVEEGVINKLVYDIGEDFSSCDIIFLCAPVKKIIEFLPVVRDVASDRCIITDVGSVKGAICKAAKEAGLEERFIGGHPMAGSEKTGYENSTDTLLENAYYLLTPSEKNHAEDIETLKELVTLTGANCVILDPARHDRITAAISHVPHLIAAALVNLVSMHDDEDQSMKTFAAGGFRDITRIASSSPQMWEDICMANPEAIDAYLDDIEEIIASYRRSLSDRDGAAIYKAFENAGEYRSSLPQNKPGFIGQAHDVFINIEDKVGVIAEVATVLSQGNINIKNIGIVNNREFAEGALRIEVSTKQAADRVRSRLKEHGYDVIDRD
ncbi:MAG: prephenate dehydrogenase [Eubacterium sp.]|nr:prephenate dehydrogenase [Eubacterium sp.]